MRLRLIGRVHFEFLCFLELVLNGVMASPGDDVMGKVVYAVNAGGSALTDSNGIFYQADPCTQGISSDYGKRFWTIGRVNPDDFILYQTERYGLSTFAYTIPISDDGEYVLVLKFAEVFDVVLNKVHTIVKDLDIFREVGHGVAHDELIQFTISNKGKTLIVQGQESTIKNHKIQLEFVKGEFDNPKINAFYVIQGTYLDVPTLDSYEPSTEIPFEDDSPYEMDDAEDELIAEERESSRHYAGELSISEKRRRRLIREPVLFSELEEDGWVSALQVGGSVVVALIVAFVIKRIVF